MPDLTRAARRWPRPPLPLALLSLALLNAQHAWAQQPPAPSPNAPLTLRRTPELTETIPGTLRSQLPSFVEGDHVSGRPDLETIVEGNAMLRRGDTVIHADRLEYYQPDDLAKARGNVRINQAGNVYEGPELELKVESFEGFFNKARYQLLSNGGHGEAERIDFIDADRSVARRATYTTCRREDYPGWVPSWLLSATTLRTDTEENIGVAENAQLTFLGISTPPIPSVSFPLNNDRKSGILPPVIGMDSVNGIELSVPYYWNIAPNRDATITPTVMSKRGVNVGTEFRYLEKDYSGQVRLDYMPDDQLRGRDRWGLWGTHQHNFNAKPLGLDTLSANLTVNRVSDDDYWRDFSRTPSLSGRLLPNEGSLNWTKGDWSGQFRALEYQVLRYDEAPILPPYDRLPQVTANYNKYDWNGFDFSLNMDYTRFRGNPVEQGQPNGERAYAVAQLSRPFLTPGSFVIPKVQLHTTSYQFDSPLANGASSASRTVPTFSLDSGLIFERDTNLFGRALRQTLEPRAFYTYTPYRNQNYLPVYDTAANDFSFATVYSENEFSGNDRISATNALTLGVTSRLLDPDTGAEAARIGIAQRRRFKEQAVVLPGGTASASGSSDILVGAQINWTPKWSLDTTVQYNTDDRRSVRSTIGAKYMPGPYRTLSAAYRYQADRISTNGAGNESIDVGWQWPLNDLWGDKGQNLGPGRGQGGGRWYSVGRLNYSLRDKTLTDAVIGFEYDGCCYIGRIVMEKLTTGLATSSKRIMFQIEFVGFTSLGSSPMRTLQVNVPRYQPLRSPIQAPSRFTNYD